jgi:hypothetical protein
MCIHAWEGGWENIPRSKEQWSGVEWSGMGWDKVFRGCLGGIVAQS